MSYPKQPLKKVSISNDAWEEIVNALAPEPNPSPDREVWHMIAEQERLRILKLLEHRIGVYGVADVSA